MRKIKFLAVAILCSLTFFGCKETNTEVEIAIYNLQIQLAFPADYEASTTDTRTVVLKDNSGIEYTANSDAEGIATFRVPTGIYEASSAFSTSVNGVAYSLNAIKTGINVTSTWDETSSVELLFVQTEAGALLIKELYIGGITKDDGGSYVYDKYVTLYNNSDVDLTYKNFCLGMVNPYNSHATNYDYVDGVLAYENEGISLAGTGIWHYDQLTVKAREEITIALNGAIDHTITYPSSVDLSKADYATYDIDVYTSTSYYPAPSENIPTENYFDAILWGLGTAWPLSTICPAFFIFQVEDGSVTDYFAREDINRYYHTYTSLAFLRKEVPNEWVLDAIEVFTTKSDENSKRLTADVDAGSVMHTNTMGYTLYRNVDQTATEAIAENEGKLVYSYSGGTADSTDPSGIDAEASRANGATIIYKDTNNSTNDFHERAVSALK
ncbi:MAG: DUF4876 domain-containing protein [Rikenellaceae bacterium]